MTRTQLRSTVLDAKVRIINLSHQHLIATSGTKRAYDALRGSLDEQPLQEECAWTENSDYCTRSQCYVLVVAWLLSAGERNMSYETSSVTVRSLVL